MTVSQYTKKYEELYKYGKKYAPDDESKAEKYRDGLLPSICRMVIASRVRTYDETVDMALELEREERNFRQYWDVQKGRKVQQLMVVEEVDQGKGSGPRDGKIVCCKCGKEGHKKSQCPIMGVRCYGCGMVGHRKYEYPQGGRASEQSQAPGLPPPAPTPALPSTVPSRGRGRGGAKQQTALTHGRAYALGHHEASEHPNFIEVIDCVCRFGSVALKADLYVLDFKDFDVIFGVDWLTKHHALMDFWERKVTLNVPEGGVIQLHGSKGVPCPHFMDNPLYQNCRITSLITSAPRSDVATPTRVVEEYMDVFPDELPGLPPKREIDFTIELHPNVKPISIPPYRMAPAELKELMTQLEELQYLGFIRPSVPPWGAPVLFVKKKYGSLRMCIDYRQLNKVMKSMRNT
ncbi:uncharacterized protein LOC120005979 [Tripterygium wilfordii]|uniref:uncharacterized protein LOC120005979 n=1 Tax=Tripterygium wilfordii TaxID=458696 RepID=UPI0018F81AEB|nr:uncharacterized protein LOC120005979 [Tripterygium wilfordii]